MDWTFGIAYGDDADKAQEVIKGLLMADSRILKDPEVKAILINIFGGIVRCDRVAQGVIDAYKNMGTIGVPIIVRLQGTNADIAKKLIGLGFHATGELSNLIG